MSMSPTPYTTPAPMPDEGVLLRQARSALDLQRWTEARDLLFQLATRSPNTTRYRAMLAYARGQEAHTLGDIERARDEWRRAVTLDPTLNDAQRALSLRARRRSWVDRLLGRA
jgi:hypothetical protein